MTYTDRHILTVIRKGVEETVQTVQTVPPTLSTLQVARSATLGPRAIQIAMVGTNFNDRWPEDQPSISPLRWLREVVEFQ